jgi:[acyl-carrier-protein] S-malonyltransferase
VFDQQDAITLVCARAAAMVQAVPGGSAGMAAVLGLEDAQVQRLCTHCAGNEVLEPVNYNAPGQVVVAGHLSAIERLKPAAREAGAKMVFVLPVSGPFHSSLMQPAAPRLAQTLASISVAEPGFEVLHNADLSRLSAASVKPALVQHLTMPVNWVSTVHEFAAAGITHVLELGPGEVLTNLCKRIAPQLVALAVPTPQALGRALQAVQAESASSVPTGSP